MSEDTAMVLARDVLSIAQAGGMPDSYWTTDIRIIRACAILGTDPATAKNIDWSAP